MIHFYLAVLVILLFTAESCPFSKKNRTLHARENAYRKPIIREASTPKNAPTCGCKSSHYQHVVPTKSGICSAYRNIQAAMNHLLNDNTLARSDIYGAAVRLVFHDAAEIDVRNSTDLYGPDGCLALNGGSEGLIEEDSIAKTTIESIWQTMCGKISRADFWALFGTIAAERATDNAIDITFQFGRRDNTACEGGAGRLPTGQAGMEDIKRVFVDQMGLTIHDAGKRQLASIALKKNLMYIII